MGERRVACGISDPRRLLPGLSMRRHGAKHMSSHHVDLFVGQMIALLPVSSTSDVDPVTRMQKRRMFPRAVDGIPAAHAAVGRPRVYSLISDGRGGGTLTVGGAEIPVRILHLSVDTPPEAAAFRVVAIAGRALRIRGVAAG